MSFKKYAITQKASITDEQSAFKSYVNSFSISIFSYCYLYQFQLGFVFTTPLRWQPCLLRVMHLNMKLFDIFYWQQKHYQLFWKVRVVVISDEHLNMHFMHYKSNSLYISTEKNEQKCLMSFDKHVLKQYFLCTEIWI